MPPGTRNALVPPSPNYLRDAGQFVGGVGRGLSNQFVTGPLELVQQSYYDPYALGQGVVQGVAQFAQDPVGAVGNSLRSMWNRAKSSPAGLGEVVGENIDPRNWLKPRKALRKDIFVGPKSKTWNDNRAAAAVQMERQGASPEQIWSATGTWRGPDGNWRQEIGDDKTKFRVDFSKQGLTEENKFQYPPAKPISEALSAPEFLAAYPEMQSLTMATRKLPDWVPDISNNGGALTTMTDRPVGIFAYNKTEGGALNTTAHELQHVAQEIEGYARGGVPTQFYREVEQTLQQNNPQQWAALTKEQRRDLVETESFKRYRSLMGEAEARATAARRNLSWSERRQRFPALDYDMPLTELTK